jgi:HK97 family phage portal protein
MAAVRVHLFGRSLELSAKAAPLTAPNGLDSTRGGWFPLVVREPYAGAWQVNVEGRRDLALAYSAVFSCVTLIASDIGKLCLQLVERTDEDIWQPTSSPAFSPVLRKPNRYQTINKFVEHWISSKLIWGNTYVLKQRDARGVVVALYVLDPSRVKPLVAPDGGVYYELRRDDLSGDLAGLPTDAIIVPAREIIHDKMICLFHPLVGVSPIFACGLAAMQGLAIQNASGQFFANGSRPSALLIGPVGMTKEQLADVKTNWDASNGVENAGKIAAITGDLKYQPLTMNAVDAQLIDQLKWTAETVCSCYHVQPYMIGVGPPPPYANVEPMLQQYLAQCLQSLMTNFETSLDDGLGILDPLPDGRQYGTEFDIDDLIWMDTATKTAAAKDGIGGGGMSPDEARRKYFGLGRVKGGNTPYMQQQMFSLEALATRDANDPFAKPRPAPVAAPAISQSIEPDFLAAFGLALRRKARERWTHAAA